MIRDAINVLVNGDEFNEAMAREVALEILEGEVSPAQIGAFLAALRIRGEKVEHLRAFATIMRSKAARLRRPDGVVLDTCGAGGDRKGTFNISTAAAIVCAGAGVRVAKHGNRSASSQCGSADVLEALGLRIDLPPEAAQRCLDEIGICFMFAPTHHPAMRHVAASRQAIGIRTIFNLLGPLSNPAGATHQLIGLPDGSLLQIYAHALTGLGVERALVVHGEDGLDEISPIAPTHAAELVRGKVRFRKILPAEFGIKPARLEDLQGGDAPTNARILRAIFEGAGSRTQADAVLLNAGAALYVAEHAPTIPEGVSLARKTIDSGAARAKLEQWLAFTRSL